MDDLSYRFYSFKLTTIGTGDVEEFISPAIDDIDEDEWDAMPRSDRREWLDRAVKEWASDYIKVSWN